MHQLGDDAAASSTYRIGDSSPRMCLVDVTQSGLIRIALGPGSNGVCAFADDQAEPSRHEARVVARHLICRMALVRRTDASHGRHDHAVFQCQRLQPCWRQQRFMQAWLQHCAHDAFSGANAMASISIMASGE